MMTFKQAFNKMTLDSELIKRNGWYGYWEWKDGTIFMHSKNGKILDIRNTTDVSYTVRNMLEDDWEVATIENCPLLKEKANYSDNQSACQSATHANNLQNSSTISTKVRFADNAYGSPSMISI